MSYEYLVESHRFGLLTMWDLEAMKRDIGSSGAWGF